MYICVRVCVYTYLCGYMYKYMYMYEYMYMCSYINTHVCTCLCTHLYVDVFMYIYIYHMCIYVYVCVRTYLNNSLLCTCFSNIIDLDGYSFLYHDNYIHNRHPNPEYHHVQSPNDHYLAVCVFSMYPRKLQRTTRQFP